jgi:hypothetical protein
VVAALAIWASQFLGLLAWSLTGKGPFAGEAPLLAVLCLSFEPGLVGLVRRKGYGWWAAMVPLVFFSLFSTVRFIGDSGWILTQDESNFWWGHAVLLGLRVVWLGLSVVPLILLLSCRSSYYDFLEREGRTPTRFRTLDVGPRTLDFTGAGSPPSGSGRLRGRTGGPRRSPRR